jgi:hypothetical protein
MTDIAASMMNKLSANAETKTCTKCGATAPRSDFTRDRSKSDGLSSWCGGCRKEAHRRWYEANSERHCEKTRIWIKENPEKQREYYRRYREANREKCREGYRRYYEANRERRLEENRTWREANTKKRATDRRNRYAADQGFRVAIIFRVRFSRWFKAQGLKKDSSVLSAVGCTAEELIAHLESQFQPGMNWDNWAYDGWHIDHKIPLASAGDDIEAMMKLWHYTNLQPLWAEENLSKGAKAHAA